MTIAHDRARRPAATRFPALALAALVLAPTAGCGGRDEPAPTAPAAVPAPAAAVAGPRIEFERLGHDFGRITDIRRYRTTFEFTNTGSETLEITAAKPSCGCLSVNRPQSVIAPGATGVLEVELNPAGKRGTEEKAVSVATNATEVPITLSLSWTVAPLIRLEPPSVDFGVVALHEPHVLRVEALYTDPQLEVVEASCLHPNVTARLLDPGAIHAATDDETVRSTTIEVTVDERAPWGSLYGASLRVAIRAAGETPDSPLEHTYQFPLACTLFGKVTAETTSWGGRTSPRSTVSVGRVRPGERFEQWTVLRRVDDRPFELLDVTIASTLFPGLEVRTEREGPAAHRIIFSGDPGDYRGHVSAVINVTTDVESEGVLTFRLLGQVR